MKKLSCLLLSIICFFTCNNVLAKGEVSVESITPFYDETSSIQVINENNNYNVVFNDINQTVKYHVVIKNTSGNELTVEDVSLTNPTQDFVVYSIEGLEKDDVINKEETKELMVTVKTVALNNEGADFNEQILASIKFSDGIRNPLTSTNGLIDIIIIASGLAIAFAIINKKNKAAKYIAIVAISLSILPVVKANDFISLDLRINATYRPSSLKILSIGNSFSVDSQEYLYQIAENLGYKNITLGNLYIGGCSLATHLSNAQGDKANYTYYTNTTGEWKSTESYKISTAVKSEDWHYITFQQASPNSGQADTYDDLKKLIEIVQPMSPNSKLVWHMTWAYQQNSTHSGFANYSNNQIVMYDAIIDAVQDKIKTNNDIDIILPVGTAIQNARTSTLGDTLTRDGYHMSYNEGRYIAGVAFLKGLLNTNINNLTYKPSGVSDTIRNIAIESANNAYEKPYTITESKYIDMSGYKRVELDLTKNAYYASLENYPQPPTLTTPETKSNVSNHKYYWATQTFTKEDLPVGTIIKISPNWQYRPEGWDKDNYTNSTETTRPANVTTAGQIVVDEAWWRDYTERGFNIAIVGTKVDISGLTSDQINTVFQIYAPVPIEENSNYEKVSLNLTKSAYYNSKTTSSVTPPGLVTAETAVVQNWTYFWATQVFTKETLPVGSIIKVSSEWQYRPDGWTIDEYENYTGNTPENRPDNVTTAQIVVDEAWWGSYTHRGFNLALIKSDTDISNYTEDQINAIFEIYVPKGTPKEPTESTTKRVKLDLTAAAYYCTLPTCATPPTLTTPETYQDVTNHVYFWATQVFTKETLPVGSIIEVAEGWQWRADSWNGANFSHHTTSSRPANVQDNKFVIDEAWWENYTHRGINISKIESKKDISEYTEDQINSVFKIYIPKK